MVTRLESSGTHHVILQEPAPCLWAPGLEKFIVVQAPRWHPLSSWKRRICLRMTSNTLGRDFAVPSQNPRIENAPSGNEMHHARVPPMFLEGLSLGPSLAQAKPTLARC